MKLSDALTAIAADYPDGCVEYYSRMNPDPWQAAHDELEKHIRLPEEQLDAKVLNFCRDIQKLEKAFKILSPKQKPEGKPWHGGLYSNSPEQATNRVAQRDFKCTDCGTGEGLSPMRTPDGMVPICGGCRTAREPRQQSLM